MAIALTTLAAHYGQPLTPPIGMERLIALFAFRPTPRPARPLPAGVNSELVAACRQALTRHVQRAREAGYWPATWPEPELTFSQRGKAAGSAHLPNWQIRLNPVLLCANTQVFLGEVIPHELCHLLVFGHHGRTAPHGREWKALMQQLYGLPGKATHSLDVSQLQGPQFLYLCHCREHRLSLRRHNKVQRGQSRYLCRHCSSPLVIASPERIEAPAEG